MPLFLGFLGVLAFSFTLPATRVAVEELDPTFVGIGREAVAVLPAALILLFTRSPWPRRRQIARLALVVLGVTLGWPLFSALALQDLTSAHSAVIVGLLPAATPGSASPTWRRSARCSASSPGTRALPEAVSPRLARSSSSSRCSRWRGRPCCSASTSARPRSSHRSR